MDFDVVMDPDVVMDSGLVVDSGLVMDSDELPGCGISSEHFWRGTGSTLSPSAGLSLSLSINPARVVFLIFNDDLVNLRIRKSASDTNLH